MGLPEVNRARIEKLNKMMAELYGEIDKIEPIVTDDSFPDIDPPVPQRVTAVPLFRSIQVTWDFKGDSYISHYEVFASKERNFTPRDEHLIWAGLSGGFQHRASTGETWFFRVRSVNRHGRASALSHQVEATTVSIDGFEIDEQYKIDTLQEANQYTEERKNEIMLELANKVDADYLYNNLILKADIDYVDSEFTRVNTAITQLEGEIDLRVTEEKYQRQIEGENGLISRMNNAESSINVLTNEINLRVTEEELDIRMGDVIHRLDLAESSININAQAIESKVEKTTYEALEQRVEIAETAITQKADSVVIDAIQQDLDTKAQELSDIRSTLQIHAGEIESRVEKNGIISSINQTAEEIKISASRVAIDGDLVVTDGLVRLKDAIIDKTHIKQGLIESLLTANLIAEKINAGTALIDFAKIGNVQITDAMITELDGQKIKANSITTEHLRIGNYDSLSPDPQFEDGLERYYVAGNASLYTDLSRIGAGTQGVRLTGTASSGTAYIYSKTFHKVSPGERIVVSFYSHYAGGSSGRVRAVCRVRSVDGTSRWYTTSTESSAWSVKKHEFAITIPSDIMEISVGAGAYEMEDTHGVVISDLQARRAITGSLIVGTLDAGQIRVQSRGADGVLEINNLGLQLKDTQGRNLIEMFTSNSSMAGGSTTGFMNFIGHHTSGTSMVYGVGVNPMGNLFIGSTNANSRVDISTEGEVLISAPGWGDVPGVVLSGNAGLLPGRVYFGSYFGGTIQQKVVAYTSGAMTVSADDSGLSTLPHVILGYGGGKEVRSWRSGVGYIPHRASSFPTGSLASYKDEIKPWDVDILDIYRNGMEIYEYYLKSDINMGKYRKRHGLVIGEGYKTPIGLIDGDGIDNYQFNSWNAKAIQALIHKVDTLERLVKGAE